MQGALAEKETENQFSPDAGQAAIKQAINQVAPAVVRVNVTAKLEVPDVFNDPFFRRFFNIPETQEQQSIGSGFVIEYADETLVLTNAHVVENATSIQVESSDGRIWEGIVAGIDPQLDLAVLRLSGDSSGLPAVEMGDSATLEMGDWVIAIGNPLGLAGSHTVTLGIVSALDRDIEKPDGSGYYRNLIQTDAAINPGNSGGPLANAVGEVVGISTAIIRQSSQGIAIEGINFAIPINDVKNVLYQLMNQAIHNSATGLNQLFHGETT